MENRSLILKVGKIGITTPVVVYSLFYMLMVGLGIVLARQYTANELGRLSMYFNGGSILIVVASYVLAFWSKKSWWGLAGLGGLYALAFLSPWLFFGMHLTWGISFFILFTVLEKSLLGICLFVVYDWFDKRQKQKELEKQNLESELRLLKNQLNPHFLFNTLNNIDSLIYSDPDKASASLIQLSGIMRYMLYETNVPEIPLMKEIIHMESYLTLQKLQYGNPNMVSFLVSGNPDDIRIAPMLLMPFVENAFKHCTDKQQDECIRLTLKIEKLVLAFEASNICKKVQKIHKDSSSGIGLDTVRKRLEYLYSGRYDLQIDEKNDLFCVSLKIRLL